MMNRKGIFTILAALLGALAGLVSAYLTWNLIYAIGTRVIQDQEHYAYATVMNACGALSGALLGVIAGSISRRPLLATIMPHILAPIPFFLTVFPLESWRDGIAEHFITIWATGAVLAFALRIRTEDGEANIPLHGTRGDARP